MDKFRKSRNHKSRDHDGVEMLASLPDGEAEVVNLKIPVAKLPKPSVPKVFVVVSRAFLEMSQEELAAKLGITKRTVSRYENGQGKLPTPVAFAIYALLRVKLRRVRNVLAWLGTLYWVCDEACMHLVPIFI